MTTLAHGIDSLFDEPWYLGTATASSDDVPGVLQVAIDGHPYIIDPAGYSRVTVPLRREATDESVEPGEQSLNTGGAWRRSQDNWFLGAGQAYLDNRFAFVSVYTHSGEDPSVRTRFWRSKGVNPWVEGQLSLLPEYGLQSASTSGPVYLTGMDGCIFSAQIESSNQMLYQYASNGSLTATIQQPSGSYIWPTIYGMSTDGYNLYIACGTSGVAILASGSTTASWMRPSAPTATVVQVSGATAGTTHYTYYIVATDANGFKSLAGSAGTITTGNATLSVPNANLITWAPVNGAVSYDVLKTDTAHYMGAGTGTVKVSTGITGTSFTDDGTFTQTAYTAPTATTQNFQATFVLYANSFLLGGAANQLVSIGANGTTTNVMTHFNPQFTWTCGSGAPGTIYVSGTGGGMSELFGVQLSTTNFALGAPYIAGQVSEGETINDLLYYEGLVILATSLGIRAAQTSSQNGFLTTGPVITDLGPSKCLSIYGSFVYFGVTNYVENDGIWQGSTTTSGLGRLSLSQFSSALLPAYASDVMSTVTGTTTGVAIINGVPWFGISGSGMWIPTGNVVPQGYLESGYVRYGTVEDKILVSTDVRHQPLNGTVQIEVVPFGQNSFLTTASNQQGSTAPNYSPASAGNAVGEAYMVIPILTRSADPTKGPVLTRWTCRAMVVAQRQDQIVVPIIWADDVLSPVGNGTTVPMNLIAEWQFLKELETSGTFFNYQEGALSYTCIIDQIEVKAHKWNDQHEMLEGIVSAKLLTVD